ncbi:MAG TPA: PH domain-containing protein [Candidatus Saccharimonadales bacterium]|nr:PH domain-containing protein [Candidatus Saccharimonadales bacterium]
MTEGQSTASISLEALTQKIMAMQRPDPSLWTYYIIRAVLSGPGLLILLPYLYFRYHTLRYRFDEEGIHMKVGIFFRQELNLTYARIQDIHLKSGLIQRWFGLANVEVQTASGTAGAELVIEGFKEYEAIRDFLYTKMRGYQNQHAYANRAVGINLAQPANQPEGAHAGDESVTLLLNIRDELRRTRELMENRKSPASSALGIPPIPPHV